MSRFSDRWFRRLARFAAALWPIHRDRIDRPIVCQMNRVNLPERRIEQHERLPGTVDSKDTARRLGSSNEIAILVEGERHDVAGVRLVEAGTGAIRRDLVDHSFVARCGKYIAGLIDGKSPDVLVVRIEESLRASIGGDLIDPSVRRRADVEAAVRRRRQRVHLELRGVKEGREFSVLADLEDLPFVSAAGPQRSIWPGDDRPQKRSGRFGEHRRGGSGEHAAVAVDG